MSYFAFIIFSFVVISPNILLLCYSADLSLTSLVNQVHPLFPALFLYILITSLTSRLRLITWIFLPFYILAPMELYYIQNYHAASSSHIIATITESDLTEALSYFGSQLHMLIFILIINTGTGLAIAFYIHFKNPTWGHRSRIWVALSFGSGFIFLESPLADPTNGHHFSMDTAEYFVVSELPFGLDLYRPSYPFGIPLRVREYYLESQNLASHMRANINFRFNAVQTISLPQKQVYVLIIGETGRADRWQLNGYQRQTTPLLTQEKNLVNFNNMISITSATRTAVPLLLTRKPAYYAQQYSYNEKSVISAFKEAGFSTYWLSTQMPIGPHETMISVYAKESDHVGFYNISNYQQLGIYDTLLIPPLERILEKPEQKQFIVLHTLGSHASFANRYPANFDIFKPSLKSLDNVNLNDYSHRVEVNNSYDNSILFTDYFLDKVIATLKKSNTVNFMFYAADHGEDLFDGKCQVNGHGHMGRKDFEIPAIAWYSDPYQQFFPEKAKALRTNATRPINPENVFYSLMDAASITYSSSRIDLSFLSPTLQDHARYINQAQYVNYDKAFFTGDCQEVEAPKHGLK